MTAILFVLDVEIISLLPVGGLTSGALRVCDAGIMAFVAAGFFFYVIKKGILKWE